MIPSVAPGRTPEGVDEDKERLSQTLTYPSSEPETRILVDDSSAKHTAFTVPLQILDSVTGQERETDHHLRVLRLIRIDVELQYRIP